MSRHLPLARCALAAGAVLAVAAVTAHAEILIDLGNDSSYRGAAVNNPDANGNYWTSVWSGAFYENVVDSTGAATDVAFGFTRPGGTDSYNGPAGVNPDTGEPNPASAAVFDAAALGSLGAAEAVFDYYTNSTFQIQGLDPTQTYDLTFYGAHKYNFNNTTRYTIYTDDTFTTPSATADLLVGVDGDHNTGGTVTISGLVPNADNILFVGFRGSAGGEGYLNALRLDVTPVPEPAALGMLGLTFLAATRRRRA